MSYRVAFLNDEEFEKLPGRDMHTKLGVAYPAYGEAYVRKSGSNAVDVFTMAHELEHLDGKNLDEHFDKENGAYYKDLMQSLLPLLGTVGGTMVGGPAGGAIGGSLGGMAAGHGQKPQQQQQQGPMGQFQQPVADNSPNVVQAGGGMGSGMPGGAPATGSGVAGLRGAMQSQNTPQDPMSLFGSYSGR